MVLLKLFSDTIVPLEKLAKRNERQVYVPGFVWKEGEEITGQAAFLCMVFEKNLKGHLYFLEEWGKMGS